MSLPTYRGFPVLDWSPDISDPSGAFEFRSGRNMVDGYAGPLRYDQPAQARPRTARTLRYLLESRADLLTARTFLRETAAGRLRGFWVPMWAEDLHLSATMLAGSASLVITRIGYAKFYSGAGLGREHVAVFPHIANTGPLLTCRKITAASATDATETLSLDAAVGNDLTVDDLVCFLFFSRADDDKLVLTWETMVHGTLEIPLLDLPTETP